ncbi:hypothetical protein [Nocardioides sp. AX2bis]|uniref:hypothetical protein n=1 Tax=Nocardioides sp. AX2bis TaxID=2653157 RepID=UPI0012F238A2|nr:hypothetical protein [Nocardioides sp. AX2bis]VXC10018.1 conserved hypothetical protein [Nocardioides sp. AX2bis]
MTAETTRSPWWMVNAIFDPDGGGADFSYTEGLAARGHPELHIWARPTDGLDPGEDWHFSQRDTCVLLNRLAWRLVDGALQVGDRWEETYDGGLVTVRFELGGPVEAASVEAFGARDAPVLPVRWSLERPPVVAPRALSTAQRATLRTEYDDLRRLLPPGTAAPPGWALPGRFSAGPRQPYGPRHAMVLARAAQLFSGDASFWYRLMMAAMLQRQQAPAGHAVAVAYAAARGAGRHGAVRRLEDAVHQLRAGLGVTWAVDEVGVALRAILGPVVDEEVRQAWLDAAGVSIESCLLVEAVADEVPDQALTLGQGAVRSSSTTDERAPGPEWLAPQEVLERVQALMARLGTEAMLACAKRWDDQVGTEAVQVLGGRTMLTSSHGPTIRLEVDGVTVFGPLELVREQRRLQAVLQCWVNDLTAVVVHRGELSGRVVAEFCRASGLPEWMARTLSAQRN